MDAEGGAAVGAAGVVSGGERAGENQPAVLRLHGIVQA
jgi:hypothetical protein